MYKIPLEGWKSWERGQGGRLVQRRKKGVSKVGAAQVGWAPINDCMWKEVRAGQRQARTCGGMKMELWFGSVKCEESRWREPSKDALVWLCSNCGSHGWVVCLNVFPDFVSITQLSDFWVISYGNWKHILGVFKLSKLSFHGIFGN